MRRRPRAAVFLCLVIALLAAWPGGTAMAAEGRTTVLGAKTNWRLAVGWKIPQIVDEQGDITTAKIEIRHGYRKTKKHYPLLASRPPAADWHRPNFDDADWVRGTSRVSQGAPPSKWPWPPCTAAELHPILARGRFVITDAAKAADFKLTVRYIGGVVVHLNGHEIARGHLPQGRITFDTLAEAYPPDVYQTPEGRLLDERGTPYEDRYARRSRTLTDVPLPARHLVKGVNVLAVAVYRAPLHKVRLGLKPKRRGWKGPPTPWAHAALLGVELTAPVSAPVVPNTGRPAGVQVWTAPVTQRIASVDYGDSAEGLRPIRLVGARNGVFSGQAVISSAKPIASLQARMGELRRPGGAAIPADAIRVRYARLHTHSYSKRKRRSLWYDALAEVPPAKVVPPQLGGAAVVPVWISVRVPRDAKPGVYRGTLSVEAAGKAPVGVPVELTVHDFTLPDPKDFATHIGLIQSPETLALEYKLPLWSDRHWAQIERSLQFTAELGNETLFIPLMCRYHFGNAESMVRWVRKPPRPGSGQAGGGWDHDYTLVEKYLDLAQRHLPKLRVVCFIAWDRWTGSQRTPARNRRPIPFSVFDPATGKVTSEDGPVYGTPPARPFWKPVYDGLRAILKKRGLEKAMMHGIAGDTAPFAEAYADLNAVAKLPWVWQGHPRKSRLGPKDAPIPVGYASWVWGTPVVPDPLFKRLHGWQASMLNNTFPRAGSQCFGAMRTWAPLALYRASTESVLAAGMRGIGRVGADFWPVVSAARGANVRGQAGRKYSLVHRFPASWAQLQLTNSTSYLLCPGKNGAIATARFEMIREGLQEAETRVFLERVLADKVQRAKLGGDLAGRCQALLDERTRTLIRGTQGSWGHYLTGLPQRTAELYTLAGEVSTRLAP